MKLRPERKSIKQLVVSGLFPFMAAFAFFIIAPSELPISYWLICLFGGLIYIIVTLVNYLKKRQNSILSDELFGLSFALIGLSKLLRQNFATILSYTGIILAAIALSYLILTKSYKKNNVGDEKKTIFRTTIITIGILTAPIIIIVVVYWLIVVLFH